MNDVTKIDYPVTRHLDDVAALLEHYGSGVERYEADEMRTAMRRLAKRLRNVSARERMLSGPEPKGFMARLRDLFAGLGR